MPFEQMDIPPLGIQDVGRYAGEYIQVGQQLIQLLLIEQDAHRIPPK